MMSSTKTETINIIIKKNKQTKTNTAKKVLASKKSSTKKYDKNPKSVAVRRQSDRLKNLLRSPYNNSIIRSNITVNSIKKKVQVKNDTKLLQITRELEDEHYTSDDMAVKKHGLVNDNGNQLDLQTLAQYIQLMNDQPGYLPPPHKLIKNCQDIVKCLARSTGSENHRWENLQTIEEFLIRVVNTVRSDLRTDIATAVINKFYSYISDPQSDADAATSIVLIVLDTSNPDTTLSTARWLVQQGDNGPAGAGLRASLSCLFAWLAVWDGIPVLGDWVLAFIKALEENDRYDILIEVAVDNIVRLFLALSKPVTIQQPIADAIFYVLSSMRQCADAFDKISEHVDDVLTSLASASGQYSRQLLQNVVDILTATVDILIKRRRGAARNSFREKYANVILCLERHMASRGCSLLKTAPWPACKPSPPSAAVANPPVRKVGLMNLGNTCYMNSVVQALLCTRRFSTHVIMRMTTHPYWSIMAMLFGKMMHSVTIKLDPREFFEVMKPPSFTNDNQHDSSEFLGYLFELLQSFEHTSDENYDYTKPPVLSTANRWKAATQSYTASSSQSEAAASGSNRRSVSPRPGSSAGGSSSSCNKRPGSSDIDSPPRKRARSSEVSSFHRDSYIDSMFGGVLLTRVECVHCHSSSLSRDVFRDLQLAFPEKPAGGQHTVQSLLEFYCSKEPLTGDNQYQCRDCGVKRDAERSVIIETTPKYLILVLKNFKFEAKLQVQSKLTHNMHYNHTVTLPTVRAQAGHASYTLYAAVVHAGSTLDSGHYYTIAKDNGSWHNYNDDVVTLAEDSLVNELETYSTPYLLFYRRNDVEEDAPPALEDLPPKIFEHVMAHNKHFMDSRLTRT